MKRRQFVQSIAGAAGISAVASHPFIHASVSSTMSALPEKPRYTHDYSPRDHDIVEYSFHEHPALPGMVLRGPALDVENRDDYFSCIGAAQTLGVYVPTPYPELLTQQLGLASWNLGVGGATPWFFLQHPRLIEYINKGRFAVLQIMTARGEPNDRIEATNVASLVKDLKHGDLADTATVWQRILKEEPQNADKYIAQSRANWERHMEELLAKITVPIINFWFSPKKMEQTIDIETTSVAGVIDTFPQFITGENLQPVRDSGHPLVSCFSDRQQQFLLRSRFTGKPVEVDYAILDRTGKSPSFREGSNIYYPSPQMHWDAAVVLGEAIRKQQLV